MCRNANNWTYDESNWGGPTRPNLALTFPLAISKDFSTEASLTSLPCWIGWKSVAAFLLARAFTFSSTRPGEVNSETLEMCLSASAFSLLHSTHARKMKLNALPPSSDPSGTKDLPIKCSLFQATSPVQTGLWQYRQYWFDRASTLWNQVTGWFSLKRNGLLIWVIGHYSVAFDAQRQAQRRSVNGVCWSARLGVDSFIFPIAPW